MPASRPRVPRYGKAYYPKTYKSWMTEAEKDVPKYKKAPLEEPLIVEATYAIPRAKTSKLIVPTGDVDNYDKATFDLLQKMGYLLDDKWITTSVSRKRFLPYGQEGYTLVTIRNDTEEVEL